MPDSLPRSFAAVVAARPDAPALVVQRLGGDEIWSWDRLSRVAGGVAAALADLPLGTPVAILGENQPRWCAAWLGVVGSGHVAVPLDPGLGERILAEQLADSGAARILATARHAALARAGKVPVLPLEEIPDGERLLPAASLSDDRALILYTSGTTSTPKGVVLTHGNLSATVAGLVAALSVGADDVSLAVLPLFHILAQLTGVLVPFAVGARVVLLADLSPAEILRALSVQGVTIFCCVPQFFYVVYQRVREQVARGGPTAVAVFRRLLWVCGLVRARTGLNLGRRVFGKIHAVFGPKMRLLITGGARFDPGTAADFRALGFDLLQGYGLTECTGNATITRLGDNPPGSVGRPTGANAVRVDTAGEIWVRGPSVMAGYHGQPERTAEAIRDGWLRTGDLGALSPDGHLTVSGRGSDQIALPNGKKILPEELEAHYAQAPFIKEICVLGRPGPGGSLRLHAAVVPDVEAAAAAGVTDLPERVRYEIEERSARLPPWQRILGFDLVAQDLPRTTTRKLIRHAVEGVLAASAAPRPRPWTEEDRAWAARPGVEDVLAIMRAARDGKAAIHPDDRLDLDLGLDSLSRIALLADLAEARGVYLGSAEGLVTVRAAVDAVMRAAPGPGEGVAPPAPPPAPVVWIAFAALRLFAALCRLLPLRVRGLERLPPPPFVLCPNHQSIPDPLFVISRLPFGQFKRLFFVGKRKYFHGFRKRIGAWLGVVVVDGEGGLGASLDACVQGLAAGRTLLLFPEGERTLDGAMRAFRTGAARIAQEAGVHLVPVRIEGAFEMWPRGRGFRGFKPVTVTFGAPIPPGSDPEASTAALREAVSEL